MDFDFFQAGMTLGSRTVEVAPLIDDWLALFPLPSPPAHVPPALLVAIMMRGYTAILDRRVPGNVHASQSLIWGVPAITTAPVVVSLYCTQKDLRNERRWLTFDIAVGGLAGERHLSGEMRFLWAA